MNGAAGAVGRRADVVVVARHGLVALRRTLHSLRASVPDPLHVAVFAVDPPEQVATYLTRQYLRGHIGGYDLDHDGPPGHHCGLDRAFHLTHGAYLVRAEDTLEFEPEWLEVALAAMDADASIGCLGLLRPAGPRGRGRPPKPRREPQVVDAVDPRCFVTRRDLFVRHECELMGEQNGDPCLFQHYLKAVNLKLVVVPGLVRELDPEALAHPHNGAAGEALLPTHEGAAGAMQHLAQTYQLGDDVLLTCMACGATELEVLAARIRFCAPHQVPVGFMFELRCPECGELHYKDDLQFRCPE